MLVIKEVKDEEQKMAVVAEVLKDLPEWFGIPESTQSYIEGAKDLRVWAAYQESDVVGFISLSYSSEDCAEIDCLGVKKIIPRSRNWKGINYDYRKRSSQTSGLPTGQNSRRRFK